MSDFLEQLKKAREASLALMDVDSFVKDNALKKIAEKINNSREAIKEANRKDLAYGKEAGLSGSLMDRLELTDSRIDAMIQAVNEIIAQTDPVGSVVEGYKRPNGLYITKVRMPIGVVGIIYESRPNVTIDAGALCLKSGNVAVLRGGKEAVHTNIFLGSLMKEALRETGLPEDAVYIIENTDRTYVMEMLKASDYIDIIIPRGGEGLIKFCSEHSLIPLIKHDKGLCHTYIDKDADFEKAVSIAYNAKVQRPGVCNAMETLLVHEDIAENILPALAEKYKAAGVKLIGCENTAKIIDVVPAVEEDWDTEYLDLILSIKIVKDVFEAVKHINRYGSSHSECIVTENYTTARLFLNKVDAAAVYANASTRFTDGGEFGLGAEIGISTNKLHCRGPMGAYDLTTTKYVIYGDGQIK